MSVALIQELELNGYLPLNKFVQFLKEEAPWAAASYPTMYKFVKQGKLRAVRVGNQLRITRTEVERWVREGNYEGEISRTTKIPQENI